MFSLILAWTNGWANNRRACDLRPRRAHYGVTAISTDIRHMCGVSLHWKNVRASLFYRMGRLASFLDIFCARDMITAQHRWYDDVIQFLIRGSLQSPWAPHPWIYYIIKNAKFGETPSGSSHTEAKTLPNAFLLMKRNKLQLRFQWSLFTRVQSTIFQHWFR